MKFSLRFKFLYPIIFVLSLALTCVGKEIVLSKSNTQRSIILKPFFYALEDSLGAYSSSDIIKEQSLAFKDLDSFLQNSPEHIVWLKTSIKTSEDLVHRNFCINFNHLTFVDLFLYENGNLIAHRKAGVFRKKTEIHSADNRFNYNIVLAPGKTYQLVLKVEHTKKYPPNFNFTLQNDYTYLSYHQNFELINAAFQGAMLILLLYSVLCWFINRYRPFIWVALFLLFIGLYGFSLQPSFIDLFFPMHPETGWLLVLVFLHLGILSFYLLMADFLEIKKNNIALYRYSCYIITAIPIFTLLCLANNIITSNYYFTNLLNLYISVIHLTYIGYTFFSLWNKLDSSQRFLLYGIIIFALGAIAIVVITFLLNEQALFYAPIISKTTIVLITILFLAGIGKKLRQHEQEKIATLKQLNKLHNEHNTLIELKVEERTLELQAVNTRLKIQQEELLKHKNHIQTLMDELSHRVKNNLQMLYSLSSFQLPQIQNRKEKQVINEMRGRIKAMMLVNDHLNIGSEKQSIKLHILTEEIKKHLQDIYDPEKNIDIKINIPNEISLHANLSLPFGLILTELFTNTFKHAFTADDNHPNIIIEIILFKENVQFTYGDNGKGTNELNTQSSMGISLIQDLTRQLKGQVKIDIHSGFNYFFTFPQH